MFTLGTGKCAHELDLWPAPPGTKGLYRGMMRWHMERAAIQEIC